ncbi:MAG: hypothetical protein R6V56_01435 [Lentisphaeria bacterium]
MYTAAKTRAYRYDEFAFDVSGDGKTGIWQFAIFGVICLLAVLAYVWLTSQTETFERRISEMRSKVAVQSSEVENLHMKAARFRGGKYIAAAVRRFDLNLRPAFIGQVRRVSVEGKVEQPEYLDVLALRD